MKNYIKRKPYGSSRKINSSSRGTADSPYLQTNGNSNGFKRNGKSPKDQYNDFLNKAKDATIYTPPTNAIVSIVKPRSINKPNKAVPKAVEKTIKAVVKALILPMYLTPYISAQVEEPSIFASPFDTPTNPKKM